MKIRNVYKNKTGDAVTFAQAEGSLLSAISYLGAHFAAGDVVTLTKEGEAQVIRITSEKEFKRHWQEVKEKPVMGSGVFVDRSASLQYSPKAEENPFQTTIIAPLVKEVYNKEVTLADTLDGKEIISKEPDQELLGAWNLPAEEFQESVEDVDPIAEEPEDKPKKSKKKKVEE